jgi:diguanylate cyclase (GGDEF)-like protein/PAS domain S-box-containing protein
MVPEAMNCHVITEQESSLKQSKVLIVEDEEDTREAFCALIGDAGYQAYPAENYDQAIAVVDSSIDLALLDIYLAGRSGLEILDYIKENHPDCPVVMISGDTDKENTIAALRRGAVEYLEKPVQPQKLLNTIKHWINFHSIQQGNPGLKDFQAMHQLLQESELQTRLANDRLSFMLASTSAVIYASKASGDYGITFISDNIMRMCGYDADSIINDPAFRISRIHPGDRASVKMELERGLNLGKNHFEYRFRHKEGHYFWVSDDVRLEQDKDGQPEFLGFWADITRRKQAEDKIREMAYIDTLTGLPNRSLYYDRLQQAIAQAHRNQATMAVLFMDLDYFKPINDELGHEWGDQALVEVGTRLEKCIRETDTVARIGGDEFSIILQNLDSEESACKMAEKVIACISKPMLLKDSQYVLGISIGICIESEQRSNVETLMRIADEGMYKAKAAGRNRYYVYHASGQGLPDEMKIVLGLEKSLRQALSKNELLIYYQPKVGLKDGTIIGTHALLRWNSPDSGIVLPDQFLPLAIKSGLINPIGEWVLQHACSQNRAWQEQGIPTVPVSVNITAEQLRHAGFADSVARILDDCDLGVEMLQLEISASDLMHYSTVCIQTLNELNDLGVKITICNFGTGSFSLQTLEALPVHELKMNRALVKQIGEDSDSDNIASAIIALGHTLNHKVVAEGVETKSQLEFFRENNTDAMLGYLASPPVSAVEIARQLKAQKLNIDGGKT